MNRKIMLVSLVLILILPMVSAFEFEFDNVKDYHEETKTYTVENCFGLCGKVADVTLNSDLKEIVMRGKDRKIGEFTTDQKVDYEDPFPEIKLYDAETMERVSDRKITLKYKIDDNYNIPTYEKQCGKEVLLPNGSKEDNCYFVLNGTKTIERANWIPISEKTILKGEYTIGIFTDVYAGDNIEWIPSWYGTENWDAWAVWVEGLEVELKGMYKLNETSGVVINYALNSTLFNGTNSGATTGITGIINTSYLFEGGDDRIDLVQNIFAGVVGDTSHSMFAWIYPNSTSLHAIITLSGDLDSTLRLNGGNLSTNAGGSWFDDPNYTIPTNTWSFVGSTYNATDNVWTLWVNGTASASTVAVGITGGATHRIGIHPNGASWDFEGGIDEVFIYNKTVSPADVLYLYNDKIGMTLSDPTPNAPVVTLNSPIDFYNSTVINITLNCSSTDDAGVFNLTLLIDDTVNTTITNSSASALNLSLETTLNFSTGPHNWTCDSSDSFFTTKAAGRNLTVDLTAPLVSIVSPTGLINLSTNDTSFNFTVTDAETFIDTCWYSKDGGTTNTTLASCVNISLEITSLGNNTIDLWANNTQNSINTSSTNFYALPTYVFCNATVNQSVLNITFRDESTLSWINASIDSSSWDYWYDNQLINRSYIYSNVVNNSNYTFCEYPAWGNLTVSSAIQYALGGYPQRRSAQTSTYTNTTTDLILYLLGTSDGIYVTFQVVTPAEQVISGVQAIAEREISGTWTIINSGITGDDGGVTFWLDPDFSHRFTFSKTGFTNKTVTLTPTQPTYTITMGDIAGANATDTSRSVTYKVRPYNRTLINDTVYTFNFTLASTHWELTEFGFIITNGTGTELVRNSSSATTGGSVLYDINTSNNETIIMNYYWNIDGNWSNFSTIWYVYDNYGAEWSLKKFGSHLKIYLQAGMFGLNDFSIIIFVFIFIFVSVGLISHTSGIYSPATMLIMATALLAFVDFGLGILPANTLGVPHFPLIFMAILTIGVGFMEWE